MTLELHNDWSTALQDEFSKSYFHTLTEFLHKEYASHEVFPPVDDIFSALNTTPLSQVKVVILGQDPYHNAHQAHGLSFSVLPGEKCPPSLVNIYKELNADLGCKIPDHGYLLKWAQQGVLLLNTVLTVRAHEPNSHRDKGWEIFTDSIIHLLNVQDRPIVFFLWGNPAQVKKKMLTNSKHLILSAPHPSPLSSYRGFFGSRPFGSANAFLIQNGASPIDWCIDSV